MQHKLTSTTVQMALYTEEERLKAGGLQMKTESLNKICTYENHPPNLFKQKNIFAVRLLKFIRM